jgi:hypothetical protein
MSLFLGPPTATKTVMVMTVGGNMACMTVLPSMAIIEVGSYSNMD